MKITGLNELQGKLNALARKAKSLEGKNQVALSELLTPDFLSACSRFKSDDEFFEAGGFNFETSEEFEAISGLELDKFVQDNTTFSDWKSMVQEASGAWVERQLRQS